MYNLHWLFIHYIQMSESFYTLRFCFLHDRGAGLVNEMNAWMIYTPAVGSFARSRDLQYCVSPRATASPASNSTTRQYQYSKSHSTKLQTIFWYMHCSMTDRIAYNICMLCCRVHPKVRRAIPTLDMTTCWVYKLNWVWTRGSLNMQWGFLWLLIWHFEGCHLLTSEWYCYFYLLKMILRCKSI